ncbi:MAG: hypothetical protein M3R21_11000 [Candidatus Dormibacteraeota bacterium]|nr:hypothetical protein [Candidatus Dormibacteraeota bacterium]
MALTLVVAASISLAASTGAQAATNPLSISVKVGYSGFVKSQQWMPVTIDITNKGADVDATLEVSVATVMNGPPIGSAIYETHVSLPAGATKHLKTYVVEDQAPAPVSARIVQNGRVLASADSQSSSAATALIGVLSDQSTALDRFSAVHPGSIAANVAHLSLDDLGDTAILLRAFDLVAIDDFATDTLTAAQRGALTDYVQNGGALLLGTGASWRKTLAGVSSAIQPMKVDSTTSLTTVGPLDKMEIATGVLNSGARAWLSEGGTPLVVERLVGGGSVTLATFDWNQEPAASWTGSNVVLRQILVRTLFSSSSTQGTSFAKGGGSSGASITERSSALSQALGSLPALDLPSILVIGILVLAYVLLVGPINYFALRALNRRALAWVTVPLIAVVASAGAFGAGVFTKGRSVQTNQVSIIHLQPGWDRAYAESYTGLLAPTRGDYRVNVEGRTLVGPITSYNGGLVGSSSDLIRVSVDNTSIALPGMTAFVLRGFATEGVVDGPRMVGTARLVNGKLTGTIRNDSILRFTDAVVLAGDGYQVLPALEPGATTTFEVVPKVSNPYSGPPAYISIYTNYYNNTGGMQPNQPTDADRVGIEKTSILSLVGASGFNGFNPTISPMVVAWTKQPYEKITVAGSQPQATAVTAVVLPLTVDQIGAGTLPTGMVVSRYVDIDGDTQPGPPGALMMQSGTVTYDFMPALAPGLHLTNASLDSTNQSPKQIPASGSSPGGQQVSVWDWAKSAWVPQSLATMGSSSLSDSAINPSSGEVRLQIHVGGDLSMLGSISLTGTVK